ncbi:leucyl aminopeptidase [Kitasatospora sp. NPDC101801]|uniref:leucyl aminopeptidase n=1 Tax=Kitasatospora sp. NPDC101801 TaxID=3364103 RepID=UPI0038017513
MSVEWRLTPRQPADTEAVVTPVWSDGLPPQLSPAFLAGSGFAGAPGQTLHLPGTPATVLLGCGPRAGYGPDTARATGARLARAVTGYRRLALWAPDTDLRALVEGYLLGGYRFAGYATAAHGADQRIDLVTADTPSSRAALAAGLRVGAAVLLARDLVNEPGEELTPPEFAERARRIAADSGLECEVWDADRIAHERLGGLLGVSRGSLLPPRLVRLSYRPATPATRRIALVGKGVTYDAGGLSLKPNAELAAMKADMAGAAAVLAAMSTLSALNCPVAVDGWLPLTENMPNGNPIRVGDVLRMRSGTTVEVRHADAEGRLILADALTLACETAPDAVIDLATLTDAAAVALGRRITALLATDDTLTEDLRTAGRRAGEELWPLPLPDSYRPQLASRVADLANYTLGVRHGTALLAGLFLREFVPPDIPWAHLDIQGTALTDTDEGEWVPGGTGVGVRTLIEYLLSAGG